MGRLPRLKFGGVTRIRVPAVCCDYGWEVTGGCPAVYAVERPDSADTDLRHAAADHGWVSSEEGKFNAKDYCPTHARWAPT